jgi:hypothetical protein
MSAGAPSRTQRQHRTDGAHVFPFNDWADCSRDTRDRGAAAEQLEAPLGDQRKIVTGTPGPIRLASHVIAAVASRMQPCDWA